MTTTLATPTRTESAEAAWRDYDDQQAHQARLRAELVAEVHLGDEATF